MKGLKELMNGSIVGYGFDYIVVEKSKKDSLYMSVTLEYTN